LPQQEKIDRWSASSLAAAKDFIKNLPALIEKRRLVQSGRKRLDKAIFSYFKGQFLSSCPDRTYQEDQIQILKSLGIYDMFVKKLKTTLLIISNEIVGKSMAGPGIRALNIARVLSQYMKVILATPNEPDIQEDFEVLKYDAGNLPGLVDRSDIVLTKGINLINYEFLKKVDKFLIIDLYDPYLIATIVEYQSKSVNKAMEVYKEIHLNNNEQLYLGDFFICASERQRDYWLGMLSALGILNPIMYKEDNTLRKLIDVVPFGIQTNAPMHTQDVLKNKIGNIKESDFVLLWFSGIYNWYDPFTLVDAVFDLSKVRDDIKLVFAGLKHPNPDIKEPEIIKQTCDYCKRLGILDKYVFFIFDWIEYSQRANYLTEADAGIVTYPDHIETRLSYRVRIIDFLWARLPIISTRGDSLSDMIERNGLGISVRQFDREDLKNAIIKLANERKFRQECIRNIEDYIYEHTWDKVCVPILNFCTNPMARAKRERHGSGELAGIKPLKNNRKNYFFKFFHTLKYHGLRNTLRYTTNFIRGR